MKTLVLLSLLLLTCTCFAVKIHLTPEEADEKLDALVLLKKAYDLGIVDQDEYDYRKTKMLDEITGVKFRPSNNGTIYTPQVKFLLNNMIRGLPRSYDDTLPTGDNYWTTSIYLDVGAIDPWGAKVELDSRIAIQERTLTRNGLNLYDGATWEIALALVGLGEVALVYERNVLYTSGTGPDVNIGGIINIRADANDFKYGVTGIGGDRLTQITLAGNASRVVALNGVPSSQITKKQAGAFFYRMIGPKYTMTDPLDGDYGSEWKYPWPNNDTTTPWNIGGIIHWNDWKPITGENVWAAITGPLQTLWIMNGTRMENFLTFEQTPAPIQLAISILPALKALQSPLGSLYHCPGGTKMFPPDPSEETNVSNENNFSGYAALRILNQILQNKSVGATDGVIIQAKADVQSLLTGLEGWFSKYLFSEPYQGYRVVYQGGHVSFSGAFSPVPIEEIGGFAVDCQTWGMIVLGQANVDRWYGFGTAYQVWQATKQFAGYYNPQGRLGGVGYTIVNGDKSGLIWSAEWTWGAVYATEKLAAEYTAAGRSDWAAELLEDARSMIELMTQPIVRCENLGWCGGGLVQEDGSYVYANDRFFIPWGWYANPLGATCSTAWAVMHDYKFNPFILGGGPESPFAAPEEMLRY